MKQLLGIAVAVAGTALLVFLSGAEWHALPEEDARIRLSWRAVGERVEECRTPTEEEAAALPAHMRRAEICEGRLTPFQLSVRIDGAPALDERIEPAGARGDRPTYVFRELRVAPGEHRVQVRFAVEPGGGSEEAETPPLTLDESLTLGAREIALVTLDTTGSGLRVLAP